MADVKLTKSSEGYFDISFDIDGNFILIYGLDEVIQNITTNLLLVKGEWFLNVTEGVDYYGTVFVKGTTKMAIDTEFMKAIKNTQNVNDLTSYKSTFDGAKRSITIQFEATTTLGSTGLQEVTVNV